MASVTATAGERGRFGSAGRGDIGFGEAADDGEGSAGVEYDCGWYESGNWMAGGRLLRHCSSWWRSSVLTAGRGMAPESAGIWLKSSIHELGVYLQ
jgi:hypothetical protein